MYAAVCVRYTLLLLYSIFFHALVFPLGYLVLLRVISRVKTKKKKHTQFPERKLGFCFARFKFGIVFIVVRETRRKVVERNKATESNLTNRNPNRESVLKVTSEVGPWKRFGEYILEDRKLCRGFWNGLDGRKAKVEEEEEAKNRVHLY